MTIIGIDPGAVCGLAWFSEGRLQTTTCALTEAQATLQVIRRDQPAVRVVIEKMSGTWGHAKEHRYAANMVRDAVKRVWGRKARAYICDVREWQDAMTRGVPSDDPKERSRISAETRMLQDHDEFLGTLTDHEYDAINLMEYGRIYAHHIWNRRKNDH